MDRIKPKNIAKALDYFIKTENLFILGIDMADLRGIAFDDEDTNWEPWFRSIQKELAKLDYYTFWGEEALSPLNEEEFSIDFDECNWMLVADSKKIHITKERPKTYIGLRTFFFNYIDQYFENDEIKQEWYSISDLYLTIDEAEPYIPWHLDYTDFLATVNFTTYGIKQLSKYEKENIPSNVVAITTVTKKKAQEVLDTIVYMLSNRPKK